MGYANTEDARTDPPMGCGEIEFHPNESYLIVESLFRDRSLYLFNSSWNSNQDELKAIDDKLAKFELSVTSEAGETVEAVRFTVTDLLMEIPEEPLKLEFIGMHHEFFERLFPDHYQAYLDSFKRE